MKIEYICNVNNTGYGRAAKAYINRFVELGHTVKTIPINPKGIQLDKTDVDMVVGKTLKTTFKKPNLRIVHEVPHTYAALEWLKNDGVFTAWFYAWEVNSLPPMFIDTLNKADYCVTFAQYQTEVYKHSMQKDNIFYLPHVMPYKSEVTKKEMCDTFTFLSMFRWDERKDPLTLLKAFLYTFEPTENVRLVLKTSAVKHEVAMTAINNIMRYSRLKKEFPTIITISHHISQDELESLYLDSDIFLSTTRGECWGYGFNEALLYGVPCIYPDSPYIVKSFFDKKNSISVPTFDTFVYNSSFPQVVPGMKWSQINELALGATMRKVYTEYEQMFELPVKIGQQYVDEQKNMNTIIGNLLAKVK